MPVETKHVTSLVELSQRRHAPEGADLQRALHLARLFEAEPNTPVALRSLAWHVVTDSHEAAGWPLPKGARFPACCGAAASTKHGCAILIHDLAEQINTIEGPVLLLGALAASRSLFGNWSVLPTAGAFVVPLDSADKNLPPANVYHPSPGVRWGSPNGSRELLERNSSPADLAGVEVLIPRPELIAARTAGCTDNPMDLQCLIFCGAARAAVDSRRWSETSRLAKTLGAKQTPRESAYHLGIDHWLGIDIPAPKRAFFALRRLLTPRRAA